MLGINWLWSVASIFSFNNTLHLCLFQSASVATMFEPERIGFETSFSVKNVLC